jgi:CubicO group peptidase (beta-lactamase class C family)
MLAVWLLLLPCSAAAAGLPAAPPESLGFSPERLARIDAAMRRYVDNGRLAGITIAIARDGKVAYLKSAGMADVAAQRPMRADTIARIYSMTKPVTAVAALMLVEEGRLRLDAPLADYLPEFAHAAVFAGEGPDGPRTEKPARPIRVRDLFTHTSGLTYGGALIDPSPVGRLYEQAEVLRPDRTLAEMSALVASLPLTVQPGTDFRYGVSTDVLGRLIEVVSGQPFETFLQQRLFDPLGMIDTGFTVGPDKAARFAEIYAPRKGGGVEPAADQRARTMFRAEARLKSGGGGLASTVGDYLRFAQMLLNGGELDGVRILSPKTVALMTGQQLAPERTAWLNEIVPGFGFGLGVAVLRDVPASGLPGTPGQYGWAGAAGTHFFIDPQEKVIAVLITQLLAMDVMPLGEDLRTLTYQALVESRAED